VSEGGRAPGLTGLLKQLIGALPPGMLMLALFNVVFLGATMWVLQSNMEARNAMLARILDKCLGAH
jgi:hypothetical protein